jgi:hypothetical protein
LVGLWYICSYANHVLTHFRIPPSFIRFVRNAELPVEVIGSNPDKEDEEGRRNLAASKVSLDDKSYLMSSYFMDRII